MHQANREAVFAWLDACNRKPQTELLQEDRRRKGRVIMGENQNEWNTNDTPRTYGDDSKLYESGQNPNGRQAYGSGQPNYGAGQQNPYGQPNYGAGQQNPYGQPNYGAGQQNPYEQPNYGGQNLNGGQTYGNGQPNYGAGQQNPYEQPNYGGQNPYGGQTYGNGQQGYGAGQQNPYGQPNYGGQNPYGYQQYGNWQGNLNPQMQQTSVTDVFCNILLGIFVVRLIISFVLVYQAYGVIDDYYSVLSRSYLLELNGTGYQVLSAFSNLLTIAMIVFVVLDIVKVSKAHYKITGLILFALLLNPGYYLWRAHILGRKKTFPIVYTVIYGGGMLAYFCYIFYKAFVIAFQFTQELM